jgi:hypothetical protein
VRVPIRDVSETKFTKILLYAASGGGKTRLVGSASEIIMPTGKPARVLIIRPPTDHTDSIYGMPVKEWVVSDWSAMWEVEDYLRLEGKDWDFVCLDSLTLWEEIGLDDVWEAAKQRNSSRKAYGRDKQEYGITMQRMDEWLRHVVGMDTFNFMVTALPQLVEDPETQEDIWMPSVQGSSGKRAHMICGYFNIVAFLGVKKTAKGVRRTLYTQQDGEHYAKDQYESLPEGRLNSPTMPKLMEAVNAARAARAGSATTATRRKQRRATRREPVA